MALKLTTKWCLFLSFKKPNVLFFVYAGFIIRKNKQIDNTKNIDKNKIQ